MKLLVFVEINFKYIKDLLVKKLTYLSTLFETKCTNELLNSLLYVLYLECRKLQHFERLQYTDLNWRKLVLNLNSMNIKWASVCQLNKQIKNSINV